MDKSKVLEREKLSMFFLSLFRLQLDIKDGDYGEVQRKTQLLSALKDLYGSGRVAAASVEREPSDPPRSFQDDVEPEQPVQVQVSRASLGSCGVCIVHVPVCM